MAAGDVKRQYRCSECGELGHNSQRCPELGRSAGRPPGGRAGQAAYYMRDHGGTYAEIGDRFGITRQAVEQAWNKLGFGDTPTQIEWARDRDLIRDRATRGLTAPEIASDLGLSESHVRRVAYHADIPITPVPTIVERRREEIVAVAELVCAGTLTLTEAGHRLGITERHIRPFIDKPDLYHRGIDYRDRDDLGRSKSERGSALVDQGLHPREAARQIGISSRTIYRYRQRHGLPPRLCEKRPPGRQRATAS